MHLPRRSSPLGFTLVELLVVLAIIGIIAAIAIPNLIEALNKGRHKRTMGDMRSIATALETYDLDAEQYPLQDGGGPAANISAILEPTYIKAMPTIDGWATDLEYTTSGAADTYELASRGRDKQPGGPAGDPPVPPITSWDDDIIYSTGMFVNAER